VEAAYRRVDLFEKRRRLMGQWAKYCNGGAVSENKVVALRGRKHSTNKQITNK
jgi:hypothetical protein